jgi:DNA-binding beta-propeller fold protein YncE
LIPSFGKTLRKAAFGAALLAACGGQGSPSKTAPPVVQTSSSPIAVSPDASRLFVVHPDADSVSAVDPVARAVVWETLLAEGAPAKDAAGHYTPSVMPRSLVLDAAGATLYVAGERNGSLGQLFGIADSSPGLVYALEASTGKLLRTSAPVCSEPTAVLLSASGTNLFVACSNDDAIVELLASDLSVVTRVACPHKPWGLGWAADGTTLLATHLLGLGVNGAVSAFATSPLSLETTWTIPCSACMGANPDPTAPNGKVRGLYSVVARPHSSELWVTHALLSSTTPEPTLAFNTTAFPAVSVLDSGGDRLSLLTVSTTPGDGHAFGDVVSGPRSIVFSPDGRYAFIVDANSEDVLVLDASARAETTLVRPLPGHMPEGIVLSPDGKLYVMERNTEDIAVLDVSFGGADGGGGVGGGDASLSPGPTVVLESGSIRSVSKDPMPSELRLGQQLFHSADSDELPITTNHWIACATCHIEDRTDAITWEFTVGPRDTPSNAGGVTGTGFLMHTADRREVSDYWLTINLEQGGDFHMNPEQGPLLDAIQDFVNFAIPIPVPPTTNALLVAQGQKIFETAGCTTCHVDKVFKTDSGCGNPNLDLGGPVVSTCKPGGVLLHDVGTCNTGAYPDVRHADMNGDPRGPCAFDTPALRGLWDAAPYMHDGSAATLGDAVDIMVQAASKVGGFKCPTSDKCLTSDQKDALVEYLKSL